MKLFVPIAQSAMLSLSLVSASVKLHRPYKTSYESLVQNHAFANERASFVNALTQVGMVSVTGMPNHHKKQEALSLIHSCALESAATQEHTFLDGTRRLTMATHTIPGGVQAIRHETKACDSFSKASQEFREAVADVTTVLAKRLGEILEVSTEKPLLTTEHEGFSFHTIADVVENGEHLEHFHSYQKVSNKNNKEETIDLHTDQGLFLVFTPALKVKKNQVSVSSLLHEGFYIELQDGSRALVEFDDDVDLVLMLGDGVNQYVNPRLVNDNNGKVVAAALRATPHAVSMPHFSKEEARVWYGRMVLPPADAIHPVHQDTFGNLRRLVIDASLNKEKDQQDNLGLGCSSSMVARQLETTSCEAGTIYCWHRCMNYTEHAVSPEICAASNLDMKCINPRSQLYVEGHGDYFPGCIDSSTAELASDYPTLPNYPRDESVCTIDQTFQDFSSPEGFDHSIDLGTAVFMWSVKDNTHIRGRLAFNGLFGFLAFGFANVGGKKNGMHGATILLALPGGNYSAANGLDLSLDPTVMEYIIDPSNSAFRHWMDPVSSISRLDESSEYKVESTDCFTAISFTTDSIHTTKFNFEGTDELIWAANEEDYYVGYHGRENRGRFAIDWPTGQVVINGAAVDDTTSKALSKFSSSSSMVLLLAAATGFVLQVLI